MSEKHAKLVRRYMKACGPDRVNETITVNVDGRDVTMKNPIVEDWRYIFTHGTAKQKGLLADWIRRGIRLEDPLAMNKRLRRAAAAMNKRLDERRMHKVRRA